MTTMRQWETTLNLGLLWFYINIQSTCSVLDVETAFLYGKLEEEIYMEIPTGYKEVYADPGNNKVLVLKMAMYGGVQAARHLFKRLSDVLITLGYNPCESDPCLMYKSMEKGYVLF